MNNLVSRDHYLEKIKKFVDKPVIKVMTGMRRSGKSFFLRLIQEYLLQRKVPQKNILYINKESSDFDDIRNYKDLNQFVQKHFEKVSGRKYLFVDEIQEIELWEKSIISFFQKEEYDIYITGSNARLLSSELATLLSGRYVQFDIYPLSFQEYLRFNSIPREKAQDVFLQYIRFGGLPALCHFDLSEETVYQYLSSLYDTIILKDVINRHQIRHITLLKNITRFLMANIGNVFSAKNIANYLKKEKTDVGHSTIRNYINYLEAAYIINKVERFDIKGKRLLEYYEKYFLTDVALRHALLGFRETDISGILENTVYLELRRRGFEVAIGKFGEKEIDFIATKASQKHYIQVAYQLSEKKTIEREFGVLAAIEDNYPKHVITMDQWQGGDYDGIRKINVVDFLLDDASLG